MKTNTLRINLIASLIVAAAVLPASAQINVSGLSYNQSFNTLGTANGTWADNSTLPGWYAANNNAGVVSAHTAFTVGAGGGTTSSILYNLGISSDPDRALGGAPASARYNILGLRLLNDTGSLFDDVQVKYDVEQWSDRGTATVTLSYQVFSAGAGSLSVLNGWSLLQTTVSPLPTNPTPVTGIGNTTGLVPDVYGGISGLGLQSGSELWFRWEITKIGGNNATHGIDNVVVAVPEPTAGLLGGLSALWLLFRRRLVA